MPRTLFDKIWDAHVVDRMEDGTCVLYIDRHLVHEVTSPQAFEGLRMAGRKVRRVENTIAVVDHNVPTSPERLTEVNEPESALQIETLEQNVKEFGVSYFPMSDTRQGIVHIVGPEQGISLPGMTIVCGDSHTSTHGAMGALAFGIGTSEVEHVLATQTLLQKPAKNMLIRVDGKLPEGCTGKDIMLAIIGKIGTAGGTGHVMEFAGEAIRALGMAGRLTMCNMSIEAGARAGLIAPDETTFEYIKGRPFAPKGEDFDEAVAYWKTLPSDEGAQYDKIVVLKAEEIIPQVTWGTSPETVIPVTGTVPNPDDEKDAAKRAQMERMLSYMGLEAGQKIEGTKVDVVFIGSCTNSRIEDLRAAAAVAKGRKAAEGVRVLVVPGSGLVKKQAEEEGLAQIFTDAGFEWREAGCSMCLGMNPDKLKPGQRCASTSNRNFEGRQGPGGRTHLLSPAMAAAAAVTGKIDRCAGAELMDKFTTLTAHRRAAERGQCRHGQDHPGAVPEDHQAHGARQEPVRGLRYNADGSENPDFVLNQGKYRHAEILVAGDNFGCGSSREHAPWALKDFGLRCVVAPSFADIFYNNCFKNGILPIALPEEICAKLRDDAAMGSNAKLTVDLARQVVVRPNGEEIPFSVDAFRKHCLLNGLDDIGLTLEHDATPTPSRSRTRPRSPGSAARRCRYRPRPPSAPSAATGG